MLKSPGLSGRLGPTEREFEALLRRASQLTKPHPLRPLKRESATKPKRPAA